MRPLSERSNWVVIGAVVFLLIGVGLAANHLTRKLADSERWVSHTHQVEVAIGIVRGGILEADNSRLRFVLMPDKFPAPNYDASSRQLKAELLELRSLTEDNREQQRRLDSMTPLVDEKFNILNASISLQQTHGRDEVQNQLSLDSLRVTNSLSGLLNSMEADENRLLQSRQIVSDQTYSMVRDGIVTAFVVAMFLLLISSRQLMVELRNRRRAEDSVRRLSGRLLSLQDEERRKVARELHDSIGQYFVSLKMNFEMLRMQLPEGEREKTLADCEQLLDSGISEARTLSHLLHPPLLDEAGFVSAAKWFVDGFTQRSKIVVTLVAPETLLRMPKDVELALFRVLQESLTNIHKHSGSASAEIRLEVAGNHVNMVVKDFGKGISASLLEQFENSNTGTGVGLAGMRERIGELGGTLLLESDGPGGTTLRVSIPLRQSKSTASTSGSTPQAQGSEFEQPKPKVEGSAGLRLVDGLA
jgi:signal transduction histidine kinase